MEMDRVPPITELPYELMNEILEYLVIIQPNRGDAIENLSAARLTSRRFYDASWLAFGKILATIHFGIHSAESMRALKAV
jgi:hypothetical protein